MRRLLERLVSEAKAFVAGLDVTGLAGGAARELVAGFAELERLAAAGKLLATGRLVESGAGPGDDSYRDVDAWLASVSGTTVGAARAATKTAARICDQPAVESALRSGALSGVQAELVATAVAADESAATRLVEVAGYSGVKGLRTECARVIAAAASAEQEHATAERVHRDRCLRHTARPDGSGTLTMTGPLDRTTAVMAALEPYEHAIFNQNRTAPRHEHPDTVAFDAMVELTTGAAVGGTHRTREGRPLATLHLHVSDDAFRRGSSRPGEICEIAGAGPIPVSTAHRLSSDAIVKVLAVKGTDVTRVVSLGRSIPAALATAIRAQHRTCVIAGCEVDRHLELDHNIPYAHGGPTNAENIAPLCRHHHDHKTRHNLRRTGPPGHQHLTTPAEYETSHRDALRAERPTRQRAQPPRRAARRKPDTG